MNSVKRFQKESLFPYSALSLVVSGLTSFEINMKPLLLLLLAAFSASFRGAKCKSVVDAIDELDELSTKKVEYLVQNSRILNMNNQTTLEIDKKTKKQKLYIIDEVLQTFSAMEYSVSDVMEES
ncbi:hypothetical protein GQR58_017898 [Nymphon striatum]|nr:hypothetical protein GQR58_017898 [Nymphon striatum]